MKKISLGDIQELYFEQQLSMQATANKFEKNITQVYKFMRRHGLARRSSAETTRINFYKSPLSFNKKSIMSLRQKRLHEAAMMLYWSEGYKAGLMIDFVNSDRRLYEQIMKDIGKITQELC